jgi:hypothetical protein
MRKYLRVRHGKRCYGTLVLSCPHRQWFHFARRERGVRRDCDIFRRGRCTPGVGPANLSEKSGLHTIVPVGDFLLLLLHLFYDAGHLLGQTERPATHPWLAVWTVSP